MKDTAEQPRTEMVVTFDRLKSGACKAKILLAFGHSGTPILARTTSTPPRGPEPPC
jgi:hypothetical protein